MPQYAPIVFGKRNRPRRPDARPLVAAAPIDQAAVFAAIRADLDEKANTRAFVVPRSFTAAFLAGLVVGCALAGFDVTGDDAAGRVQTIADLIGARVDTTKLLPVLIMIGLLGGARIAAVTVLFVHTLLNKAGRTDHASYALGGATASVVLAGALCLVGHPPAHGWIIECLAGAGSGVFYRIFAGMRPAG